MMLNDILDVLESTGGYLVLPSDTGEEFVIMRKADLEVLEDQADGVQLDLLDREGSEDKLSEASADDMLERINRDIAMWKVRQEEDDSENMEDEGEMLEEPDNELKFEDDLGIERLNERVNKVKFEPLKGDLAPELQE